MYLLSQNPHSKKKNGRQSYISIVSKKKHVIWVQITHRAMCSLIEERKKKKEEDSVENNFDPLLAIYYLFTTWYYVRPQ